MSMPTTYTPEVGARILASIAEGISLRTTCSAPGMPDESTVRAWATKDAAFFAEYERARLVGCHGLADDILRIGDAASDRDSAAAARVQCDNRKWLLSKLLPRTYGDRLTVENTGTAGTVIVVNTGVSRSPGEASAVIEGVADAG